MTTDKIHSLKKRNHADHFEQSNDSEPVEGYHLA